VQDRRETSIGTLFSRGDLIVVNDARTLPASLPLASTGAPVETFEGRLLRPPRIRAHSTAWDLDLLLFQSGDRQDPTEARTQVPGLRIGAQLRLGHAQGHVVHVDPRSPRMLSLRFDEPVMPLIHRYGFPIQYAYMKPTLDLWDVQTLFARAPWAVEAPSAAYLFDQSTLRALQKRGVEFATLTHAAGLSSTGEAHLDALLPLPEDYEIPEATARSVRTAIAEERRVIALGTSVARALEGNIATFGALRAGRCVTDLRLSEHTQRAVVTGMLTGVHEQHTSHFELLRAFSSSELLVQALAQSHALGFTHHEFGDGWYVEGPLAAAA
jgi:S-adenosylmethionine:tRNA ribosyltransferase-isomerase